MEYQPSPGLPIPPYTWDDTTDGHWRDRILSASELPQLLIKLDEAVRVYRTVVTRSPPSVAPIYQKVLKHPPSFCLPWLAV